MFLFLLALAATGCAEKPDLSTPRRAAGAFVDALNAGDHAKVIAIIGDDALAAAAAHCEAVKKEPPPPEPTTAGMGEAFADMAKVFYEAKMTRRRQDCTRLSADLAAFVKHAASAQIKLGENKTEELTLEPTGDFAKETRTLPDGSVELALRSDVKAVVFRVQPPGWNGERARQDTLYLVEAPGRGWVPRFGDDMTPIGNIPFALPITWGALQ